MSGILAVMDMDDLINLAWLREQFQDGTARRIRERAALRRTEVAEAAGISCATLQRWEAGFQSPRGEPALRYAQVLRRLALFAEPAGCITT
jgi:transcriptional regulator with XRE-family HTH domain